MCTVKEVGKHVWHMTGACWHMTLQTVLLYRALIDYYLFVCILVLHLQLHLVPCCFAACQTLWHLDSSAKSNSWSWPCGFSLRRPLMQRPFAKVTLEEVYALLLSPRICTVKFRIRCLPPAAAKRYFVPRGEKYIYIYLHSEICTGIASLELVFQAPVSFKRQDSDSTIQRQGIVGYLAEHVSICWWNTEEISLLMQDLRFLDFCPKNMSVLNMKPTTKSNYHRQLLQKPKTVAFLCNFYLPLQ